MYTKKNNIYKVSITHIIVVYFQEHANYSCTDISMIANISIFWKAWLPIHRFHKLFYTSGLHIEPTSSSTLCKCVYECFVREVFIIVKHLVLYFMYEGSLM